MQDPIRTARSPTWRLSANDGAVTLGKMLERLHGRSDEPSPIRCALGAKLGDNLVVTVSGDTLQAAVQLRGAGPTARPQHQLDLVHGNGYLRRRAGSVQAKGDGTIEIVRQPSTGANVAGGSISDDGGPSGRGDPSRGGARRHPARERLLPGRRLQRPAGRQAELSQSDRQLPCGSAAPRTGDCASP